MALPYPDMDFVPFDILTAQELDQIVANIEAPVTPDRRQGGFETGFITGASLSSTGNLSITGLGFKPKKVTFHATSDATEGAKASAARSYFTQGYMIDNSGTLQQFAFGTTSTTSYTSRFSYDTFCHVLPSTNSLNASQRLKAISFDPDGFTVDVDVASSANGVQWVAEA